MLNKIFISYKFHINAVELSDQHIDKLTNQ